MQHAVDIMEDRFLGDRAGLLAAAGLVVLLELVERLVRDVVDVFAGLLEKVERQLLVRIDRGAEVQIRSASTASVT